MIFVHEVHDVAGGKMAEYGEAVRTRWPRVVGEPGQARLLWYWELAHGTGASYQAVSLTAVRDWAAWGDLTARAADWRREVAPLLREVTAKILLPAPWSPLADADLASEPAAREVDRPALYLVAAERHREGPVRQRAVPELVAALALPLGLAPGVAHRAKRR